MCVRGGGGVGLQKVVVRRGGGSGGGWKEKCLLEHRLAGHEDRKPWEETGTERKKMGGQSGGAVGDGEGVRE